MQSAFTPTVFADTSNTVGLTIAMMAYMGDVNIQEPPRIDYRRSNHSLIPTESVT